MPTPKKKNPARQAAMLTLTRLEQVRVLADPLRLRIVEQFCTKEQTTKQVAEVLGEKPTKLYHHVDALEKVGLIRQTRTRRNRGTLERYYISVARAFKADAKLFVGDAPLAADERETVESMVETIFGTTAREVNELSRRADSSGQDPLQTGILSFLHLELNDKGVALLTRRLKRLLSDLQSTDKRKTAGSKQAYRMTLAFYPLDPLDATSDPEQERQ